MTIREYAHRFLNLGYIFDTKYVVLEKADKVYMLVGLLLVILGAAAKLMSNQTQNPVTKLLWHRLAVPLVVGGILEVVWYSFRVENVTALSAHFVAWLIAIITLVWFIFPVRYYFTKYDADKKKWEKQQVNAKYIKR